MREYLRKLDPKHSPPYRLERTRILEVMMDIAMHKLNQILTEQREQLHYGFVSGTIDFWSNSHCREQYGLFVIDFPAEKYKFENGSALFMSKKT